jgi:hypothetical protein
LRSQWREDKPTTVLITLGKGAYPLYWYRCCASCPWSCATDYDESFLSKHFVWFKLVGLWTFWLSVIFFPLSCHQWSCYNLISYPLMKVFLCYICPSRNLQCWTTDCLFCVNSLIVTRAIWSYCGSLLMATERWTMYWDA